MKPIEVHKFGGTSVGTAERIRGVARIAIGVSERARVAVVASAMSKVTDTLVGAAASAAAGRAEEALAAVDTLRQRHHAALRELVGDGEPEVDRQIDGLLGELEALLRSVALLGEISTRVHDRVVAVGEKLSIRLVAAAIRAEGHRGVAIDADTFLETDDRFGSASPLGSVADRVIAATLRPVLDDGVIPVITGFIGRAPDGATTTLGRGGSDLSATILAGALDAHEVTIWTDVDGVFSADPRIVPEARVLDQLNYREAGELSYYGAKVLHQRTMIPVADKNIPVWTRNSFNPSAPGTVVDGRFSPGSHPVKGVSAVRDQCLLSLEGKGMAGVPGVAARMFAALAQHSISVTMISQSSSESSICIAVPDGQADEAEKALKSAFRGDLSRGDVEEVVVQRHVGLVAAVGLGMAHTPGIAARVFQALGKRRINVLAIAQGSSELNISLAVDRGQIDAAVRALHEDFGLHRLDTGEDSHQGLDLLLIGVGNVGRQFVELVLDREAHAFERFGLRPRVVGVCDRTGFLFRPTGIPLDELRDVLGAKARRERIADQPGAVTATDPTEMIRHAGKWRLARPVLVDLSDANTRGAFEEAFRLGFDVVSANKKPFAGPMPEYRSLRDAQAARGRILRVEATVGAGLPVLDTLDVLLSTGDRLRRAEGCFSGTLGFVMSRLQEGARFSDAVKDAVERGYTEPDPVSDLCGADVARKALILGRFSGLVSDDTGVDLEGLVDISWMGLTRDELFARLETLDAPMAHRIAAAKADGQVVRYVATVEPGKLTVGPRAVPADSPIGRLQGSDNLVVFTSDRYHSRPLVVQGPGAGVEVTAMGVLGDVFRVAAERR